MKRFLTGMFLVIVICSPAISLASSLSVSGTNVTKLQVYEDENNGTAVWIHLNGNPKVGPNPVNTAYSCELWTHSRSVHATALAAMISGKKIDVDYVDDGRGTYWCNVRSLSVVE